MTVLDELVREAGIDIIPEPAYAISGVIPEPLQAWIETERSVYRRWASQAESPASRALLASALEAGHHHPEDLATMIAHRPVYGWAMRADGERRQLHRAICRMVDFALDAWRAAQNQLPTIARIVIWQSDATEYEVHARGTSFRLSASDLLSPAKFAQQYLNACQVCVSMPKAPQWRDTVNGLLQTATCHDFREEGNDAYFTEIVRSTILRLPIADEYTEEVSRVAQLAQHPDGRWILCLHPLVQRIRGQIDTTQPKVAATLVTLGAERGVTRWPNGGQARVWFIPSHLAPTSSDT